MAVLFLLYYLIRVWCDAMAILLQTLSEFSPLWKAVPIQGGLSLGFQWLLAPRFGSEGVLLGLIFFYAATVAWILHFALMRKADRWE